MINASHARLSASVPARSLKTGPAPRQENTLADVTFGGLSRPKKAAGIAAILAALGGLALSGCSQQTAQVKGDTVCQDSNATNISPESNVVAQICGNKPSGGVAEGIVQEGQSFRVEGQDPLGHLDISFTKTDSGWQAQGKEPMGDAGIDITSTPNGWHTKGYEGYGNNELDITSQDPSHWTIKGNAPDGKVDLAVSKTATGLKVAGNTNWGNVDYYITVPPGRTTPPADEKLVLSVAATLLGDVYISYDE